MLVQKNTGAVYHVVRMLDVLFRDRVCSNHSGDAHGAHTELLAKPLRLYKVHTHAAPSVNMDMTASFFFISIFTLITIGIGRTRITTSAMTSVN
jgi:hypothetical protein